MRDYVETFFDGYAHRFDEHLASLGYAGAAALQIGDLIEAPPSSDMLVALGLGATVSFVAGVGALFRRNGLL